MEKENIHIDWEVISKSFRGELSGEERERLERWLAASSRHRDFYRRALEGGETDATVGVDKNVLAAKKSELMGRARMMKEEVLPRRSLRFVWYAAAVILPVAIAVGMWVNMEGKNEEMIVAQRVQSGSGRAVLELHDGRTYFLDTTRVVETGIEGNLAKAEKQSLVYTKQEADELVYNKVIVPRAGEYSLTLSDGTRVWLNSDSEIRYPVAFGKERRTVFLSGEAYFEVAKDSTRPFIVHVGDNAIEVLGTHFNVVSYKKDELYTTLVEGMVKVSHNGQSVILNPDEQAIIEPETSGIKVREVDASLYVSWINGRYEFRDTELENIAAQLSRWYDVDIRFAAEDLKRKRLAGVIYRDEELGFTIKVVERVANVRFIRENNTIYIDYIK